MRDIEAIGVPREMGCTPNTADIDELLDERTAAILFAADPIN
jgi:hypothetical protein